MILFLVLYIIAAVIFGICAFQRNLIAAGLLAWVLVPLIETMRHFHG